MATSPGERDADHLRGCRAGRGPELSRMAARTSSTRVPGATRVVQLQVSCCLKPFPASPQLPSWSSMQILSPTFPPLTLSPVLSPFIC